MPIQITNEPSTDGLNIKDTQLLGIHVSKENKKLKQKRNSL